MTDGHELDRTLHEHAFYPPHGPRAQDSHYRVFHAAQHRLIRVLGVGCWIGGATLAEIHAGLPDGHRCGGAKQLEAHHEVAEFAGLNEVDWQKVAADFPNADIHSDEDFLNFAESEGGLTILCDVHHRGPFHGIHSITYPVWELDRIAREGWSFTAPPKETP